ncbi:MAG: glycine cleavage system protein GcvH [Thaumarchaeota archaeon]|nr:glycine cleavage system protein GcvH [Nitrososphaerota archaeon]
MVDSQTYEVLDGYLYTKDHEWIGDSRKSSFLVGITDYAAKMLNDIVYVTLPKEGTFLHQRDVYGQVESVKTVSDMYMPVSGKIIRTNSKLGQTPELVSNAPYTDGWMLEISSEDFSTESKELLNSAAYRKFIDTLKETD